MTKSIRDAIKAIVPFPDGYVTDKVTLDYREKIIEALAMHAESCTAIMNIGPGEYHCIQIPVAPVRRGVTKAEIMEALRDDDYTRAHALLADRIEKYGIE